MGGGGGGVDSPPSWFTPRPGSQSWLLAGGLSSVSCGPLHRTSWVFSWRGGWLPQRGWSRRVQGESHSAFSDPALAITHHHFTTPTGHTGHPDSHGTEGTPHGQLVALHLLRMNASWCSVCCFHGFLLILVWRHKSRKLRAHALGSQRTLGSKMRFTAPGPVTCGAFLNLAKLPSPHLSAGGHSTSPPMVKWKLKWADALNKLKNRQLAGNCRVAQGPQLGALWWLTWRVGGRLPREGHWDVELTLLVCSGNQHSTVLKHVSSPYAWGSKKSRWLMAASITRTQATLWVQWYCINLRNCILLHIHFCSNQGNKLSFDEKRNGRHPNRKEKRI